MWFGVVALPCVEVVVLSEPAATLFASELQKTSSLMVSGLPATV